MFIVLRCKAEHCIQTLYNQLVKDRETNRLEPQHSHEPPTRPLPVSEPRYHRSHSLPRANHTSPHLRPPSQQQQQQRRPASFSALTSSLGDGNTPTRLQCGPTISPSFPARSPLARTSLSAANAVSSSPKRRPFPTFDYTHNKENVPPHSSPMTPKRRVPITPLSTPRARCEYNP